MKLGQFLLVTASLLASLRAFDDVYPSPLSEEEQMLPTWSDEDMEAVSLGRWIPGSNMFGRIAKELLNSDDEQPIELDPQIWNLPEEEAEPVLTPQIEAHFREAYFQQAPSGLLIDPQKLLPTQQFQDRETFLTYHHQDSLIDIYLYLFDGHQKLPAGESLAKVVRSHYEPGESAVVVFYFLGDPKKTQIEFTSPVREILSPADRDQVFRMSLEEALEKSDASSQLESFSVQLSMRLYRFESLMATGGGDASLARELLLEKPKVPEERSGLAVQLMRYPVMFYSLISVAVVVLAWVIFLIGRWRWERHRSYLFPETEVDPLLEAPFAAGFGGRISFSSSDLPPSRQKPVTRDFLERI